jgi:hypothetical protein
MGANRGPHVRQVRALGPGAAPECGPKILIHTRQGNRPAKILKIEPQDDPWRAVHQAMPSMVCPQTSVKVLGGRGTSVAHMLAMALDDPSMDRDLEETVAAHEIVLAEDWADVE